MALQNNQPIDIQALNLAKAIGKAETEGKKNPYQARGASGEFGAYQFMPNTWKERAKKYLGDANAVPNVENQNKVQYAWVKEKKDKGYTPAQIASMHNAGESNPDAYKMNMAGVNSRGVRYDVPGYVAKVSSYYKQLSGANQPQQPTPEPQQEGLLKSIFGALTQSEKNLGEDIGRGILGGDKFQQGLVSQYENNAKRLLELSAKQQDPQMKQKYYDMAQGMFEEGKQAGEDFKGRSWEQIAGDVLGTALDVGTTVSGLGAVRAVGKAGSLASKVGRGAIEGAKYGSAYGFTGGLQEGEDIPGIAKSTLMGAGTGALTGGLIEGASGLAQKGISKVSSKFDRENINKEIEDLAGRIVYSKGNIKDTKKAAEVLYNLDVKNIKTGDDLEKALINKEQVLSGVQDSIIAQKGDVLPSRNLRLSQQVAGKSKNYNYLKDGLDQLKNYYISSNNKAGADEITALIKKLNTEGMTLKDVQNVAKTHGQVLKGFNASGELSSGLSKQSAENTRKGIKSIIRQNLGQELGQKSQEIDKAISKVKRVRDLVEVRNKAVNALRQKLQNRNILQKLSYGAVKGINAFMGGVPKAMIEALGVSNVGNKIDNFVALENSLSKDLTKIQKLMSLPDEQLVKNLNLFNSAENISEGIGKISNIITQKSINLPQENR